MRRFFVMRGVQGSGKSTLTADIKLARPDAIICSADKFFVDPLTGMYEFDFSKLGLAHAWCFEKFREAVAADDTTIILDNTNIRVAHFIKYVEYAETYGYQTIICQCDLVDADAGAERNLHGLEANKIQRGIDGFEPWERT